MKIKTKRLVSFLLTTALTLGMVQTSVVNASPVAEKNNQQEEYEIYPKPHEVNYLGDEFVIRKDVNVVYDSTIDKATKNSMTEILKLKEKNITESNAVVDGKTNILVGTHSSDEYVDNYVKNNYEIDESVFEKIDSYYTIAKNGEIIILGKNTDAAFYGITTLKHIFNQMDGSTIKNFEIKDYADTAIRGFIEGYYGIPWTNEDRMSLMKFGGEFKMTSYIFAPKDDLYHTRKWRELYPADQLAEIEKMVKVGIESKTRFVWTAHPFMGGFNANDFEGEMKKLIAKFEQLYSVGVRQFGVLGDDVGNLNKKIITDMMNRLSEWGKAKGDVYDWVFCPAGYNASWQGDYSELNVYDKDFPKNVQIFWTGNSVCAPIIQNTLDNFRRNRAEEGKTRRSPLFWLNWPVNDINMSRLMMGKGSLLHTDINIEDLAGVVTNPMQDAEPSKVAIFAVSDYSWNVKGFNEDKSWKDSFKYVDSDASEALHTIAKHTSDPAPNGHGLVLGESEEIKPLLDEFTNKLKAKESVTETGAKLLNEMDTIIKACNEFVKASTNKRMVEQITPFANSLKDLSSAIKFFIQSSMDLESNNKDSAVQNFAEGTTLYENSKKHERPVINGVKKAQPGSKRLVPFVESVRNTISEKINEIVNSGQEKLELTAETNISNVYQGKIENIIDGKNDTYIWNGVYEAKDQYYQVNLSKPTTIYGVDILNGNNGKPEDTFGHAKVQYTTDGNTWKDMNNKTYGPYAVNVKISNVEINDVVGVRYICTATDNGRKWPAMREFRLLTTPPVEAPTFTSEVIRTTDGWGIYSGKDVDMLDGNENTGVHYRVRQGGNPADSTIAGDYVGVKLSEPIVLGKIKILQGPSASSGDYFKNATLEYSLNGTDYKEIKQCVNERDIEIDLSNQNIEAQYVRLRNNQNQHNWIGFREFQVNAKINHNGKVYTNVENYKDHPADYFNDNASMVELNNITLGSNQYIGLKLDRIHELTEVIAKGNGLDKVTLQVSKNGYEWTNLDNKTLSKNTDARYIRLINLGNSEVTFDIKEFRIASKEISKPTIIKNSMGKIHAGKPEDLFDKDRTTGLQFERHQTKGDHMIIDLGQEIDLNELKIVVHDSHQDYLRDGKVYASIDQENWGDAIIQIGDQIANTIADDSTINESFPDHEISYNVAKATDINKKVRYLKLEITQSYGHRWTKINEIEINGGAYIPSVNNPTFKSNVSDTQDGLFEYLVDGNITTMFIPSSDNGQLVYSVSENNKSNHIKVMQNAKAISNAKVSARILSNDGSSKWVTLGKLNKGTNEFNLPSGTTLLDVKFEWSGVVPNLVELMIDSVSDINVDKTELQKLIDENLDTTNWTTDSAKVYNDAIEIAKELVSNSNVSQGTVDSSVKEIENAKANKKLKGDSSLVQSAIDAAETDEAKYTAKTWKEYQKALNAAKKAMEDVNNLSEDDVTVLIDGLTKAKEALVYNPTNREEAEVVLEDITIFINTITNPEKTYTKNSWKALIDAKTELEKLIELNKTKPQEPALFEKAKNVMLEAKNSLVNVTSLVSAIEEFEAINDPSIYTEKSYKAYESEITKAKELLTNGAVETVEKALENIAVAKKNLELVGSSESIKVLINELKALNNENYTANSYKTLMDKVNEIDGMNFNDMTEEELKKLENELLSLKNDLVDVTALRKQVEIANGFEADLYTKSSYDALMEVIKASNEEFTSGTIESIQKLINQLDAAIKALEARVNNKELSDYINAIEDLDLSKYTDESVAKYNEALSALKAMLENAENISAIEFVQAKNNFENAKAGLELKADKEDEEDNNNSNNNDNNNGNNGDKLPQTGGVSTNDIIFTGFLLISLGAMLIYNKRSKLKEQ